MEEFENKVKISEGMEIDNGSDLSKVVGMLNKFLLVQQRRAETYSKLKSGFTEYMASGRELAYQQLCSEITVEFGDCSKQVLELESIFLSPEYRRDDLAGILRSVQTHEKEKLNLTATIQVLKKAGRPSERLVRHDKCKFKNDTEVQHECVHVHEITEDAGTEEAEAEADAEYDIALNSAIRGVQLAVTAINEHLEEIRYEIAAALE